MTRKKRRIIFYVLVIMFLGISSYLALYSQGFRLDTETLTLKKTGGIFVKSDPARVDIYIDGAYKKRKMRFLSSGTLIQNLLPGNYVVEVRRDEYRTWSNKLPVEGNLVTEIKDLILLPDYVPLRGVATSTVDFWLDEKELIIRKDKEEGLVYLEHQLPGEKWVDTINNLIVTEDDKGSFWLYNLNDKSQTDLTTLFNNSRKRHIDNLKDDSDPKIIKGDSNFGNNMLVGTETVVYKWDLNNLNVEEVLTGVTDDIHFIDGIAYMNDQEAIWRLFRDTIKPEKLVNLENKGIKEMGMNKESKLFVLTRLGEVYEIYNGEKQKIAEAEKILTVNKEMEKVAFLHKDNHLIVYTPSKNNYQTVEIPEAKSVEKIVWLNANHLLIKYPESIFFLEIANENIKIQDANLYFEELASSECATDCETAVSGNKIYWLNGNGSLLVIESIRFRY